MKHVLKDGLIRNGEAIRWTAYLSDKGPKGANQLVLWMRSDEGEGILNNQNISRYAHTQGKLDGLFNTQGVRFLSDLLAANLIQDVGILERMPAQIRALVDIVSPFVQVASCCDAQYDISRETRDVFHALTTRDSSEGALEILKQKGLKYRTVQSTEKHRLLLHFLYENRRRTSAVRKGFSTYAARASQQDENMMFMPGFEPTVEEKQKTGLDLLLKAFEWKRDASSFSGFSKR
jgi:hypothetical protein